MNSTDCTRRLAIGKLPAHILVVGLLSGPSHAGTEPPGALDPFIASTARPASQFDIEKIKALVREDVRTQKAIPITEPGQLARLQFERSGFDRAMRSAERPGCQTRYAGMGLLAVIPLLVDTVRGSGCKW